MPIYEDLRGRSVAVDTRPVSHDNGHDAEDARAARGPFTTVKEAAQQGSLDDMAEAVVREAYGAMLEPYADSLVMQGYRDIGGASGPGPWQGPIDLLPEARRQEVQWARTLALFSPPAKNAIRLHRTYVLGQGIPMPTAPDSDVQQVIDDFWNDGSNDELTSHQGQAETDASWITTGELFLALYVDGDDGHVKVRSVEPLDVDCVVTDPDDRRRILYYRVRQHRDTFNFNLGQAEDDITDGADDEFVYFPDWQNTDEGRDPYSSKATPKAPGGAVMASFPLNRQGVRGIPEFCAATPWIHSHKRLIENQSIMSEARKRIALIKTVKGGPQAVGSSAAVDQSSLSADMSRLERNPARAPGSTYVKNKGIELEYPDLSTGADDAQRDAELQAQMIGSAMGWGTHYLLMSTEFHRLATAVTMELPTLKMCLEGQQRWLDMLRSVLDFCLLHAAKAGTINAPVVTKHGRELVDWKKAAPALPSDPDEAKDEPEGPRAGNADPTAPVREAIDPTAALAQQQQHEDSNKPESAKAKAKVQRGTYTLEMPPILNRDLQPTITAIVAAVQAGLMTPEQGAEQVYLTMGAHDVGDKMEEWRVYLDLHAKQVEEDVQQAQDQAHKQLAAKAGGPPGALPDGGAQAGGLGQPKAPGSGQAPPSGGMSRSPVREGAETSPFDDGPVVREAAGAGRWVTLTSDEGIETHCFIGMGGLVERGPRGLIGANIAHLPPPPHRTHHPVGHEPAGAREHPHYAEHQPPAKPEPKPGKPYARHSGAAQTRQEQPKEGPEPLSAEQSQAGLSVAQEATRAHQQSQEHRAKERAREDAEIEAYRQKVQAERKQDEEDRTAADALHQRGTQAERAHVKAATPALLKHLRGEARTPEAKKALKRLLAGHDRPAHQLLALAESLHQWAPGYDHDVRAESRAAAPNIMNLAWPRDTGAAASDAYIQAQRHLRDLTKEKGALPSQTDLDDYMRHGIARRVGPHLAQALADYQTRKGVQPREVAREKATIEHEDTVAGQVTAFVRAVGTLGLGTGLTLPWDAQQVLYDAAIKAASGNAQANAFAEEYSRARRDAGRLAADTHALPRTGAQVDLHADRFHDAPEPGPERLAYMRGRDFRAQFAQTAADPAIAVRAGVGATDHPQHQERAQAASTAVAALPGLYRRLYQALGNDVTVHGKTKVELHPDLAGKTHPETGLPTEQVGGTYDGQTSHLYGNVKAGQMAQLTRHEVGHGIDAGAGRLHATVGDDPLHKGVQTRNVYLRSHQRDFLAIWKKHKENTRLWSYMRTTPGELFAEGFAMYHRPGAQDALAKAAPELHAFFAGLDKEIAGYAAEPTA